MQLNKLSDLKCQLEVIDSIIFEEHNERRIGILMDMRDKLVAKIGALEPVDDRID